MSRIQVNGWAGDDHIAITSDVTVPAIVDGGAGDDTLVGGGGPSILLGGPGNDDLLSGDSRNILIGGEDRDRLREGPNDNLLIGGVTIYDHDVAALVRRQNPVRRPSA